MKCKKRRQWCAPKALWRNKRSTELAAAVSGCDGSTDDQISGQPFSQAAPTWVFPAGASPFFVTTGDANGDGLPDALVSNREGSAVSLLLNTGGSTFRAPIPNEIGQNPAGVRLADLDGDGSLDMAASNFVSHDVSVLLGDGLGGFAAQTFLAAGGDTFGLPELLTARFFSEGLVVLRNIGGGEFLEP